MNASDYGGGTPIVDVWRRDVGMAVGHVEVRPKLVSLPVSMPDAAHAKIAVRFTKDISHSVPGKTFIRFAPSSRSTAVTTSARSLTIGAS